jgi:hypothetical protein
VLRESASDLARPPFNKAEIAAKVAEMRDLLINAPIDQCRRFLQLVIERVIVNEPDIEVIGPQSTLAEIVSGVGIRTAPGSQF